MWEHFERQHQVCGGRFNPRIQLGESNYASYADLQSASFEVTKQNWAFKLTAESSSTIEIPSFDARKSVCYVYDETTSITYYSRQSPLTIKDDVTKTGNLFCGWYTEQNGGGTT